METIAGRVTHFGPTGTFVVRLKMVVTLRIPGCIMLAAVDDPMQVAGYVDDVRADDTGGVVVTGELDGGMNNSGLTSRLWGLMKGRRLVEWQIANGLLVPVHPDLASVAVDSVVAGR
ncbi:hypothetical protein CH267_14845 [Rhodococcus sp. 06-621-2]|nr:hypothetical protein [Rhodococcus sp. 06-621-2]OZC55818.1 hypothetical protein CH267_14845 [Rhodococcus sp. 06-621-2]